jgi:signal transduction histidine kinase
MPELAGLGVGDVAVRAVQDHVRRTGMAVETSIDMGLPTVSLSIRIALYRAVQELLSNALRHGGGSGVRVALHGADHDLRLAVADSGPGFDVETLPSEPGLGLAGMREQAELLGGDFEVASHPGQGTVVRVHWPIHAPDQPPAHASTGGQG